MLKLSPLFIREFLINKKRRINNFRNMLIAVEMQFWDAILFSIIQNAANII